MAQDAESRITELEERYTYQQRLLAELNDVAIAQQRALDALSARLRRLEERLSEGASEPHEPFEKPPHY